MAKDSEPRELRYNIGLQINGYTLTLYHVTGDVARDWLWEHLAGGTVESDRIVVQYVSPLGYYPERGSTYDSRGDRFQLGNLSGLFSGEGLKRG